MTTLAEQLERLAGQHSNALDVMVEVALFKPGTCYTAVRPNAAGTKVIYTDRAGNEVTCWARDWTGSPNLPQIIAALKTE